MNKRKCFFSFRSRFHPHHQVTTDSRKAINYHCLVTYEKQQHGDGGDEAADVTKAAGTTAMKWNVSDVLQKEIEVPQTNIDQVSVWRHPAVNVVACPARCNFFFFLSPSSAGARGGDVARGERRHAREAARQLRPNHHRFQTA